MKRALTTGIAGLFGVGYAAFLATDEGQRWIDENTTLGVVIGVGAVLGTLRLGLDRENWRTVRGAFVAAGAPLVVRGAMKRLG